MANDGIVTRLPVALDNIPSDDVMAAKYFLDIVNYGTPEMRDCMRAVLRAMWLRLIMRSPDASDGDLGNAIGDWYRRLAGQDLYNPEAKSRG